MRQNDLAFCRIGKQSILSTTGHTFCSSSRRSCSSHHERRVTTVTHTSAGTRGRYRGPPALRVYLKRTYSYLLVNFYVKSVFAFSKLICVTLFAIFHHGYSGIKVLAIDITHMAHGDCVVGRQLGIVGYHPELQTSG